MGKLDSTKTVGILGVTFKKNTDDVRDSTAIPVVSHLLKSQVNVKVYDPKGMDNFKRLQPGIVQCSNAMSAIDGSDLLIIFTEWEFINDLEPHDIRERLRGNTILDTRYMLDKGRFKKSNLTVIN